MNSANATLVRWKARHAAVTWIGILLNVLLAAPLLICPTWTLDQLGIAQAPIIWPMAAAGAYLIITCFYIPMTIDIDRFRIFCWLSILPARAIPALFFIGAVVICGASSGFLIVSAIDGVIAIAWLTCMINIVELEQAIATGRADP